MVVYSPTVTHTAQAGRPSLAPGIIVAYMKRNFSLDGRYEGRVSGISYPVATPQLLPSGASETSRPPGRTNTPPPPASIIGTSVFFVHLSKKGVPATTLAAPGLDSLHCCGDAA